MKNEEQEDFIKEMSWNELRYIRDGLSSFLEKQTPKEPHEKQENPKQQLLFD